MRMREKVLDLHGNGLRGEVVRFGIASIFSASLSLSLPVLFHNAAGFSQERAVALAFVIVFIINFLTMRAYVFQSGRSLLGEILKFALTSGVFRIFDYALFVLIFRLSGLHYILVLIITLTVTSIGKFILHRSYTFGDG